MIDAFAVHRRDHAGEGRRLQSGNFDRRSRSLPELNTTVDFHAFGDEGVLEGAGGEAGRVLNDIDVLACAGPRADRAVGHDRTVALLAEPESRSAPGNCAHVGDEWNRAGGRLERY